MNFAEELIKEVKKEKTEKWEAEDFMKVFYPDHTPDEETTARSNKNKSSFYNHLLSISSSGDIQFKFNYNHGNKSKLEELGIEVVK